MLATIFILITSTLLGIGLWMIIIALLSWVTQRRNPVFRHITRDHMVTLRASRSIRRSDQRY